MKRKHSEAFRNDIKESGTTGVKIQPHEEEGKLSRDTLGVILSFTPIEVCSKARLVCKEWEECALYRLEEMNMHLQILGNNAELQSSLRECISGLLNVHTIRNDGSWVMGRFPSYFRTLLIDGLVNGEFNSLFEKSFVNAKNITISDSRIGLDDFKKISGSDVEMITFYRSNIEVTEGCKFPSLKTFVSFYNSQVIHKPYGSSNLFDELEKRGVLECLIEKYHRFTPKDPTIASLNYNIPRYQQGGCKVLEYKQDYTNVKKMYQEPSNDITSEELTKISWLCMPNLEEAWFHNGRLGGIPGDQLSIKKLVFTNIDIDTSLLFKTLTKCTYLEELCLIGCNFSCYGREMGPFLNFGDEVHINQDDDDLVVFEKVCNKLVINSINGCKIRKLVLEKNTMADTSLFSLLNCSITDRLKTFYCLKNRFTTSIIGPKKENRLVTRLLLGSKCLTLLETLVTDIETLSNRSLERGSKGSDEYLLLSPPNMPNLRNLTIDMRRNPRKATDISMSFRTGQIPTVKSFSVLLEENDPNFIILSDYIPSIRVLSIRGTQFSRCNYHESSYNYEGESDEE